MEEEVDPFDPNFEDVLEAPTLTKRQILESGDFSQDDPYYVLDDGMENFVVLPKVYQNEPISEEQALDLYNDEDVHIGIFQSEYSAVQYAEQLEEIAKNIEVES